jgi:hypothetical protein
MPRPTPFTLLFAPIAAERFPGLRAVLERERVDPRDRDAFLLAPDVVALVHELRPADGMGGEIGQLAALVHHAYLYWLAGAPLVAAEDAATAGWLAPVRRPHAPRTPGHAPPEAWYAQLPERRVWAQLAPDAPHEPLDGCFVHAAPDGALRVLGVFGLLSALEDFSVAEAAGPEPGALAREDGTPLFAPALPGGAAAGLHSIVGEEELLELGWRTRPAAARQAHPEPGA